MARQPEQRNAPCPAPPPQLHDSPADSRAERVGGHLRNIYDDVLSERVPDSFEDLLRKLA